MAIQTVCDIFYRSVDTFRKAEHLQYKKDGAWQAVSSEALRAAVEETSMGLRALGVEKGDRVAILSENRPEWAFADLAVLCGGAADATIGVEGRLRLQRGPGGQGRRGAGAAAPPPPRRPLRPRSLAGDDVPRRAAGEGRRGPGRRP